MMMGIVLFSGNCCARVSVPGGRSLAWSCLSSHHLKVRWPFGPAVFWGALKLGSLWSVVPEPFVLVVVGLGIRLGCGRVPRGLPRVGRRSLVPARRGGG